MRVMPAVTAMAVEVEVEAGVEEAVLVFKDVYEMRSTAVA